MICAIKTLIMRINSSIRLGKERRGAVNLRFAGDDDRTVLLLDGVAEAEVGLPMLEWVVGSCALDA